MPTKSLPSAPNLEHLKYQAKDLLKASHNQQPEALARIREFHPEFAEKAGPEIQAATFSLSDAQLVVAREYGFESWARLKRHVESLAGGTIKSEDNGSALSPGQTHAERVAQFLAYACPDHHIRGGIAHIMARNAAMRLLKSDPEIARANLYTACVCGEIDVVKRILSERPTAVSEKHAPSGTDRSGVGSSEDIFSDKLGSKNWEPLLYLCFARVPIAAAEENTVAIARALLDCGANPNVYFMAGNSRYTPLVGVIGEGEENRLPHSQRDALAALLLERGANPFDIQVIYNLHFQNNLLWYLKLIYQTSIRTGRRHVWDDPDWSMLGMGGYGCGARFLLTIAIRQNDMALAEWTLDHGANPNAAPPAAKTLPQTSLHEYALQLGRGEIATLLAEHGATIASTKGEDPFTSACFSLNRHEAERLARERPDYLLSPRLLMDAAKMNRADVVKLLLDLGMSPNIADPGEGNQHALHVAAYSDSVAVAELLIQRGAEVDFRESNYSGTALDFAVYGERWQAIELLSRHSKDVWALTFLGRVERLRDLLTVNPKLAQTVSPDGETPLMYLPDDESAAVEIARLFLDHGADLSVRNKQGKSAADLARKRHLDEAASILEKASKPV